ncbi:MAG: DUF5777 family beta-barrel protein [Flavobacteriaceae bacterium]|nr:DUF5777 family beta-barrel protein [Flavobacteriaceae bacterium]
MKNHIKILLIFLMLPFMAISQKDVANQKNDSIPKKVKEKLERDAFETPYIIDNPTNIVLNKKQLNVEMQHRFGEFNNDKNDMAGIWGLSNIRIGLAYGLHDRLTVGFGTTKDNRYQDFNWKVAIFRQTRSNRMPFSVSYYGNWVVDARSKENFKYTADRWSFFNQIILTRRFSPKLSVQGTLSLSHYNVVKNTQRNDMLAYSLGGRYKITDGIAIMFDYSQPLTKFLKDNPNPGISLGVEFGTSSHAFQIFVTNYHGIVPQDNYMFNRNDFFDGNIMLGFNITRLYSF